MTAKLTGVPNHHADYPGFAGLTGFIAAATMVIGGKADARLAERLSGLEASDMVVDIGCGPGTAVRHAGRLGASVVGVDPAPVMLRVARLLTRRTERARFVEGSAEALPLPDSSVSVVWSIASVHHWSDLDAGLREARRVLKPGGRLVAIEKRRRPDARGLASHGWTDEQARSFVECCLGHGFADARTDRHASGGKTKVSVTAIAPCDQGRSR
jgi:ubiquinone/menaquinone biosynthesis C-methylase UbiE